MVTTDRPTTRTKISFSNGIESSADQSSISSYSSCPVRGSAWLRRRQTTLAVVGCACCHFFVGSNAGEEFPPRDGKRSERPPQLPKTGRAALGSVRALNARSENVSGKLLAAQCEGQRRIALLAGESFGLMLTPCERCTCRSNGERSATSGRPGGPPRGALIYESAPIAAFTPTYRRQSCNVIQ